MTVFYLDQKFRPPLPEISSGESEKGTTDRKKRRQPREMYLNFKHFRRRTSVPFDFPPGIYIIFGHVKCFVLRKSHYFRIFPRKFPYRLPTVSKEFLVVRKGSRFPSLNWAITYSEKNINKLFLIKLWLTKSGFCLAKENYLTNKEA